MPKKLIRMLPVIVILMALLNACTPKPGLSELAESAVRLEVWRKNPLTGEEMLTVEVTDPRILFEFSELIKQAQKAGNEAQLPEYCHLVFHDSKYSSARLPVYCDNGKYAIGFGESSLWLPQAFMISLDLIDSLPQVSGEVSEQDQLLLAKYDQRAIYRIAKYEVTLPHDSTSGAGSMPIGAYWHASNVLSRDIGLDFLSLFGRSVEVVLYKLRDPLTIEDQLLGGWNETRSRAVILHHDGRVVGAWLDAGPGIGCSLSGRSFLELEPGGNASLDELVDANGPALSLDSEELIREYFDAIDSQDYVRVHALEDISFLMKRYMFESLRFDRLYQEQFAELEGRRSPMSLSILLSCKVTSVTPMEQGQIDFYYGDASLPPSARVFLVRVEAEWDQNSLAGNMSNGDNELVVVTCQTNRGELIVDICPR